MAQKIKLLWPEINFMARNIQLLWPETNFMAQLTHHVKTVDGQVHTGNSATTTILLCLNWGCHYHRKGIDAILPGHSSSLPLARFFQLRKDKICQFWGFFNRN
jgi:hypothetical protein